MNVGGKAWKAPHFCQYDTYFRTLNTTSSHPTWILNRQWCARCYVVRCSRGPCILSEHTTQTKSTVPSLPPRASVCKRGSTSICLLTVLQSTTILSRPLSLLILWIGTRADSHALMLKYTVIYVARNERDEHTVELDYRRHIQPNYCTDDG